MKCSATSQRTGQPCGAHAVTGRSVCYHHGGKSLIGVASPSFKDGRYSKALPPRLRDRYEHAVGDPHLLVLREDIALLDARLADLLTRVESGESGARWKRVKVAFTAFIKVEGTDFAAAALADLRVAIFAGVTDVESWSEIHGILAQREKLVASERKRLVDLQQMVTAEQVHVLLAQVVATVKAHVSDRAALAGISAGLARLVALAPGESDRGSGPNPA